MALIEYDTYKQKLRDLRPELDKLSAALDIGAAKQEARRLEDETAQDGFWNDLERSQKVQQRLKQLQNKIARQEKLLAACGCTLEDVKAGNIAQLKTKAETLGYEALSEICGAGAPTLTDIVKELSKPGRDPRDELPPPILRTDVMEAKDLKPGMELQGTVRNVIDFGVFVDIGVHQDGLVHISKLPRRVCHPAELLSVGDVVTVWVVEVDEQKKRISLTMKKP